MRPTKDRVLALRDPLAREAIGQPRERHCDACFTGEYPLAGTETANGKYALELPMLSA